MALATLFLATALFVGTLVSHPARCIDARYYEDGGTIGTTLVGAERDTLRGGFDGRMREGSNSYPQHCFVGADYVGESRARLLPFWGQEEREFVTRVQDGLDVTLSRKKRD